MKRLLPVFAAALVFVACSGDDRTASTTTGSPTTVTSTTLAPTTAAPPTTAAVVPLVAAFAGIDAFVQQWNRFSTLVAAQVGSDPAAAAITVEDAVITPVLGGLESVAWKLNGGIAVGATRGPDGVFVSSGLFVDPDNELASTAITTYLVIHATDPTDLLEAYVDVLQSSDPTTVGEATVGSLHVLVRKKGADVVNDPVLAITAIPAGIADDDRAAAHQIALDQLLAAFD